MRINRVTDVLRNYLEKGKEDDAIKDLIAEAVADVPSNKAAETVKYIYLNTEKSSSHYYSICLFLAICRDRIEDKEFIERTYRTIKIRG